MGVGLAGAELLLFLDDDDVLLPGGIDVILQFAQAHPKDVLYLFACLYLDGTSSFPAAGPTVRIEFDQWLRGEFDAELKPVARRAVFARDGYDDTGASGEGILWGRVIRRHGAVLSRTPIIRYNADDVDRLSSGVGLIARAGLNALIVERFLEEFGDPLRKVAPARHAERVQAALVYHVMAGQKDQARALVQLLAGGGYRVNHLLLRVLVAAPPVVARVAFLTRRRELLRTIRGRRLATALRGPA